LAVRAVRPPDERGQLHAGRRPPDHGPDRLAAGAAVLRLERRRPDDPPADLADDPRAPEFEAHRAQLQRHVPGLQRDGHAQHRHADRLGPDRRPDRPRRPDPPGGKGRRRLRREL
ncbi:hypothetical protein HK102_012437, partial [Quaeritorhiza haematococci]